jgi:uncharacterized protein YbjT (DUF2867 family)
MKIIVTGATGLVGAEVLRLTIQDNDIEQVTALTRRPATVQHPKIRTVIHNDFLDYSGLEDLFKQHDACLWCLGISVSQVKKEQYHVITYDYAVAAAQAMLKANPSIHFVFLSGEGADPSEKSRLLFERIKGKTENALMRMPFTNFHIARPGAIKPVNKNPNAPFVYKLFLPIYPVMEFFAPHKVISSVQVARALLHIAKHGAPGTIIRNTELKKPGQRSEP